MCSRTSLIAAEYAFLFSGVVSFGRDFGSSLIRSSDRHSLRVKALLRFPLIKGGISISHFQRIRRIIFFTVYHQVHTYLH